MFLIDGKPVSEDRFNTIFTRLSNDLKIVIVREQSPTVAKQIDTVSMTATFYFKA